MQRLTIRRFDVIRTANVVAVLYALMFAVFGLIFLVPFALFGIAGSNSGGNGAGLFAASLAGGLIFYVLIVAFYSFIGWIATIIVLGFYNFVAGRMGGIRFVVDVEGPAGGYPGYPGYPAPAPYPGGYPAPSPSPYAPGGPAAPGPGTAPVPRADPPGYGAPPAPPA